MVGQQNGPSKLTTSSVPPLTRLPPHTHLARRCCRCATHPPHPTHTWTRCMCGGVPTHTPTQHTHAWIRWVCGGCRHIHPPAPGRRCGRCAPVSPGVPGGCAQAGRCARWHPAAGRCTKTASPHTYPAEQHTGGGSGRAGRHEEGVGQAGQAGMRWGVGRQGRQLALYPAAQVECTTRQLVMLIGMGS